MNYLIVRRNDTLEYKQKGLGTKLFLYMANSLLDQALENESRKQHKSCLEINQIQAKLEYNIKLRHAEHMISLDLITSFSKQHLKMAEGKAARV